MHANVGPSIEPGSGRSETPPDHKSMSAGCLQTQNETQKNVSLNSLLKI